MNTNPHLFIEMMSPSEQTYGSKELKYIFFRNPLILENAGSPKQHFIFIRQKHLHYLVLSSPGYVIAKTTISVIDL